MKIANIEGENHHNLLNDLKNFNENFRKDMTFDNIKNHKKLGLLPLSSRTTFGNQRGVKLSPPAF